MYICGNVVAMFTWCWFCTWGRTWEDWLHLWQQTRTRPWLERSYPDLKKISDNETTISLPCATIVLAILGCPGAGVGPFVVTHTHTHTRLQLFMFRPKLLRRVPFWETHVGENLWNMRVEPSRAGPSREGPSWARPREPWKKHCKNYPKVVS